MSNLDEDEENLALFLESEILSEVSDHDDDVKDREERTKKRKRTEHHFRFVKNDVTEVDLETVLNGKCSSCINVASKMDGIRVESGILSRIPPELFQHILKFLSSEDLISCSQVCKFLSYAASDESLWRRLYCLRWGLFPQTKVRDCAWKKLYIKRDEEDMVQSLTNCQPEFKEYYLQMYAAKRSQAPLLSQVIDDRVTLDKTLSDQVSSWKSSRGLGDKVVTDHSCSGEVCTYFQIGNVFICEKTGNVHVCDDTCKEVISDPANELLVCTISGRCFDRLLSPSETEGDADELQPGVVTDEAEPFMGAGRFARAYLLGYNCVDEKELEAALRFC